MSQVYQRLFPQQYITKFLSNNVRQDSRNLDQYRSISIESNPLPHCNTSAQVSIGNTKVLCGVTYELGLPSIFTQRQGQLHLKVSIASLASVHMSTLHQRERNDEADSLQHLILELMKQQQDWIDLSQLYITDKCVWNVYVDIEILHHDGNIFDAVFLAFQHALKLTQFKYSINIPFLPIQFLLQREKLYQERLAHESYLKSTQEDYKPSLTTKIPAPTNNHIEIPHLEYNLSKYNESILSLSKSNIGIVDPTLCVDDIINTLDTPAKYEQLLFPPIIINEMFYPSLLAIIPYQQVITPEQQQQQDEDLNNDTMSDEIKQKKPKLHLSTKKVILLDPTYSESLFTTSSIQIIFDCKGNLRFSQKTSGTCISPSELLHCYKLAANHCGRVAKLIQLHIQELAQNNGTSSNNDVPASTMNDEAENQNTQQKKQGDVKKQQLDQQQQQKPNQKQNGQSKKGKK